MRQLRGRGSWRGWGSGRLAACNLGGLRVLCLQPHPALASEARSQGPSGLSACKVKVRLPARATSRDTEHPSRPGPWGSLVWVRVLPLSLLFTSWHHVSWGQPNQGRHLFLLPHPPPYPRVAPPEHTVSHASLLGQNVTGAPARLRRAPETPASEIPFLGQPHAPGVASTPASPRAAALPWTHPQLFHPPTWLLSFLKLVFELHE